jgi:hypothetical protein
VIVVDRPFFVLSTDTNHWIVYDAISFLCFSVPIDDNWWEWFRRTITGDSQDSQDTATILTAFAAIKLHLRFIRSYDVDTVRLLASKLCGVGRWWRPLRNALWHFHAILSVKFWFEKRVRSDFLQSGVFHCNNCNKC